VHYAWVTLGGFCSVVPGGEHVAERGADGLSRHGRLLAVIEPDAGIAARADITSEGA
jgi:hypothetical protein